jgi:hypothetical protein
MTRGFARLCALLLCCWTASAAAQWLELGWVDPRLRWRTLETANFSVHFPEQHRSQARLVAGIAESVYPRITGLLDWRPQERTHLVVLDAEDFANGYASPLPFNYFALFLTPPDAGELLQNREWLELVITHELFHIVHLDKARRAPAAVRRWFGRNPFLFPNVFEPRWMIEGLAVHAETDAARQYGRRGQSHYQGMMRAEVARGLRSLREINADGRGFPLNRNYLYGSYFFAFLQERYGEKALADYIESYSGNLIPFKLQSTAIEATGKPMDELWVEYHDWLRVRFSSTSTNTSASAGQPVNEAFSLRSPVLAPGGERWYVRYDGYTKPRLVREESDGRRKVVRDVEHDTRVFAAGDGGVILAQPEICRNYRHYYDLFRVSAEGRTRRLTECGRYRFVAPLEDARLAALRVDGGAAEVLLLDADGREVRSLYRAAAGESLTGLATRGDRVVVTRLLDGSWSLLELGDGKPRVLVSDAAIKHSPRFGATAGEIYFVADYGGTYNVWSLRRDEGVLARWTDAWTGVREISDVLRGEMLLSTIEADGDVLRLYALPPSPLETRPVATAQAAAAGAAVPEVDVADWPYSPWSSLRPRSWLPLITVADGMVALGVATFGQDALGLHQYALAPVYEFTQRELLGSAQYIYDARHGVALSRSMTVKATSERDERTFLRDRDVDAYTVSEKAQWVSLWRHLSLSRRFYGGLGGVLEREILRGRAVFTAEFQDERVLALLAGVDTRRAQWLSEGPSQGQQLRLFAETSRRLHAAYDGNVYRADWRVHVPVRRSVLALRWNEAYGQPGAEPFQLGGSDSDETFILPLVNQREFALRGYGSGEPVLSGHRARVGTLEWRTALADVDRHAMVPPVGLNRVSTSVFFEVGAAWEHDERPDYHRSAGIELLTELRIGYLFGLQLRLGFAKGLDAPGGRTGYLQVGRSF